jgi:hypothetical protein
VLAFVFLLYEVAGTFANLCGGWLAARFGNPRMLMTGLGLQIAGLLLLSCLDPPRARIAPHPMLGRGAGPAGQCALSMVADQCGDHAASANCPAISRFTRCTVPLPTPTIAATLRMPLPALRCSPMAFSILGDTFGRPICFPAFVPAMEARWTRARCGP